MEKLSFIVTGASASGKSSLVEEASQQGFIYLPTHTTREKRPGEIDGIHNIFISSEKFEENFSNNQYLEPDLDYAMLKSIGVYYGTPVSWISELEKPERCASPVAIKMARKVLGLVNVNWIHLVCNDTDRYNRLKHRGISEKEALARMNTGESAKFIPTEAKIMNTSELKPNEIVKLIRTKK